MNPTKAALALALTGALLLPGVASAQDAMQDPNAVPMQGNLFVPAEKTVAIGTTVTWINLDAEDHDVITNDFSTIVSPLIKPGESFSFTFEAPGSFAYVCDLHRDMAGVINVVEGAPAATAEPLPEG
jgi:plastocyanin